MGRRTNQIVFAIAGDDFLTLPLVVVAAVVPGSTALCRQNQDLVRIETPGHTKCGEPERA